MLMSGVTLSNSVGPSQNPPDKSPVASLAPRAQLAWEAPMACGFGACFGCVVEIDGRLKRLCIEGPVLTPDRVFARVEAAA